MDYELEINGWNAAAKWGAVLGYGSLAALMSPPPMKDYITNESAATAGRIVANAATAMPKADSRDVQLTIYIHASTKAEFFSRHASFVAELQKGRLTLRTSHQQETYYRLLYVSCSQFSQFNGKMGKFTIKFNEPDPTDRDADD